MNNPRFRRACSLLNERQRSARMASRFFHAPHVTIGKLDGGTKDVKNRFQDLNVSATVATHIRACLSIPLENFAPEIPTSVIDLALTRKPFSKRIKPVIKHKKL